MELDDGAASGALVTAVDVPARPAMPTGPLPTDAELIAGSLRCPDLFGQVYDRHAATVGRFLARRAMGAATVDDLLADTFLTAFRLRERFDRERDSARPWLLGIASHVAQRSARNEARRWRAHARADAAEHRAEWAHFEDQVLDRVDAAVLGPALATSLSRMRADDRSTLLLLAWGQLTYAEIAEALDVPVGTVRSRVHRARRQLRASLAAVGITTNPFTLPHPED